MDYSGFMDGVVSFAQNYSIFAIILALGLLYFIYHKPKLFCGLLILNFILAGVFYWISSMADSGSEQKKKLIREAEQQHFDK